MNIATRMSRFVCQETNLGCTNTASLALNTSKKDIPMVIKYPECPVLSTSKKDTPLAILIKDVVKTCVTRSCKVVCGIFGIQMLCALGDLPKKRNENVSKQVRNADSDEAYLSTNFYMKKRKQHFSYVKRFRVISTEYRNRQVNARLGRSNRPSSVSSINKGRRIFLQSILIACALFTVTDCNVDVEWNLARTPALFGENLTLECNISDAQNNCGRYTRQWYGGKNYGLLCQNGMCRNEAKYDELTKDECTFILVIQNFAVEDLDQEYSCSYGISNDRKSLQLNDFDFVAKPVIDDSSKSITYQNDTISVEFEMRNVYPKPRCFMLLTFINHSIASMSIETNSSFVRTDPFYSGNITFHHKLRQTDCMEVNVSCLLSSTEFNILQTTFGTCKDAVHDKNISDNSFVVFVVLGVVFGVVIIVASVPVIRKRTRLQFTGVLRKVPSTEEIELDLYAF